MAALRQVLLDDLVFEEEMATPPEPPQPPQPPKCREHVQPKPLTKVANGTWRLLMAIRMTRLIGRTSSQVVPYHSTSPTYTEITVVTSTMA